MTAQAQICESCSQVLDSLMGLNLANVATPEGGFPRGFLARHIPLREGLKPRQDQTGRTQ